MRSVLAVVAGYLLNYVAVFALVAALFAVLGPEGMFEPESWRVSTTWAVGTLMISLVTGVLGGWVCRAIAASWRPPAVLIALVFVMGMVSAGQLADVAPPEGPRPAELGVADAMADAMTPSWLDYSIPVTGSVGIVVGAWLARRRRSSEPSIEPEPDSAGDVTP